MNVAMCDSKQQTHFELGYGSRRSRYLGRLDLITFNLPNFALRHRVFLGVSTDFLEKHFTFNFRVKFVDLQKSALGHMSHILQILPVTCHAVQCGLQPYSIHYYTWR